MLTKNCAAGTKTWTVTSPKSRHPEWGGMTVPLGETFPNGLDAPGDPAGSADDTANCHCILDIGK